MASDGPHRWRGWGWVFNRVFKATAASILLGASFAVVNALSATLLRSLVLGNPPGGEWVIVLFYAPFVGAVVGLLGTPALALVMISREPGRGLREVAGWTTLACVVSGLVEWILYPPIAVYVLVCILWLVMKGPNTHAIRPGHCVHCQYDLRGLSTDVCPECGSPRQRVCHKCSYSLTGLQSLVCPKCGTPRTPLTDRPA